MAATLDPALSLAAGASLALVFAAAAVSKLRTWREFPGVVQNYRLVPVAAARPVAGTLPVLEAMVAVGLVATPARPYAALAAVALLAMFSLAVAINLARGRRHIDCGCFRFALRQPLSWWLVGRNVLLIAVALIAGTPGVAPRQLTWLDGVTVGGAALSLFVLYLAGAYVLGPPPFEPLAAEGTAS